MSQICFMGRQNPRKRSTSKSPFELVYGETTLFPSQLEEPDVALIQEAKGEPNALTRRMNQLVELNENREKVMEKLLSY